MSQLTKFTEKEIYEYHKKRRGKITIKTKTPLENIKDLSLAYTPGVAKVSESIYKNKNSVFEYTNLENNVAVITDGSAVLGLGDIGPYPAMAVMEGKSVLFKELAGVDAFPICLNTKDPKEIIKTIENLEPSFSGINLEDIKAPKCFEIEKELKESMDIPIFHDDQHGTAIVVLAGLINALKEVNKKFQDIKVVINGAGAAGIAIAKILITLDTKNIILCDRRGAIYEGRAGMNKYKEEISKITNKDKISGKLADVIKSSDVFIGVSVGNLVDIDMVKSMNKNSIVFALANPTPEISPDNAKEAGAKIIATGRSDYPNQLNNVMGFPGIFRGALDVRAKDINEDMKIAAAYALANLVKDSELKEDYIIPNPLNKKIVPEVAYSVAKAAIDTNVAKLKLDDDQLRKKIMKNIF